MGFIKQKRLGFPLLILIISAQTVISDILRNQKDRGIVEKSPDQITNLEDNTDTTPLFTLDKLTTLVSKDLYQNIESEEPKTTEENIEKIETAKQKYEHNEVYVDKPAEASGIVKFNKKIKIIEENNELRNSSVDKIKVDKNESENDLTDESPDGPNHPCYRECETGNTMTCHFKFNIEWYQSLSKACYNCPYNLTDCDRKDCITGDGITRSLTVINRKLPGPKVEVCVGDTVIVDVTNSLLSEGTTVHWHGHHQRNSPYMDGAPLITQCPIPVGSTFRYTLASAHAGTHFWHSHAGMQRADGAFGAYIVRNPKDRHKNLYDYDRSSHVMIVLDWTHELGVSIFTKHHHSDGDNKPPSLLVNGKGRFQQFKDSKSFYTPAARFDVEQGYSYRFRIVNAEFLNCPIEMSIDKHNITIIASDGNDVEPVEAVSLVTYAGERFDFIVHADEEIDNYWIRFRGLMDCDARFTKAKQVAVLHYEGALDVEPDGNPTWEESHQEGLQVNALNKGTGFSDTMAIPELTALDADDMSLRPDPDIQYYISYDFYDKDNSHFHKYPFYGFHQVPNVKERLYTPQLNHISMKMQSYPLLPGRHNVDHDAHFCNESTVHDCKTTYCECTHVVKIPLYSVVELIMVDEGVTFDANHPFHLHGYAFRVVAMNRLASRITVEDVKKLDAEGKIQRKLSKAPQKDTVTVPDGGYTIIRFYADNPGYWLFHCHIEFHVEIGMSLVFKVGEHSDLPPVPPDFPQCGNYLPTNPTLMKAKKQDAVKNNKEPSISITQWWPLVYFNKETEFVNSAGNLQHHTALIMSSIIIFCIDWAETLW